MKKLLQLLALFITMYSYGQTVSTIAGSGIQGYSVGDALTSSFQQPAGLAIINTSGDLYMADNNIGHTIRKISGNPLTADVLAGRNNGQQGSSNGTGAAAYFETPIGTAADSNGNCFVIEYGPNRIRKITPAGVVTTFAATTASAGVLGIPSLSGPKGIAIDGSNNIYVANSATHTIIKITPAGVVTTVAGSSGNFGNADGTGTAATFYHPQGIDLDALGNIYVADSFNNLIRKITPAGVVTTLAGGGTINPPNGTFADGTGSAARFKIPEGIAVDAAGTVYVADTGNNRIRKITAAGVVTTIAGGQFGDVNGGPAVSRLGSPTGIAINAAGNTIYVSDAANRKIKKIVLPLISAQPTASLLQTFCNGATVANLASTGTTIKWYAAATGGTELGTTALLTTGSYYVSQTQTNAAESTRLEVQVNITAVNAPTAQVQAFCNSATVSNLTATGAQLKWYAAQTGGSQLASATALATGNYFVSQTVGTCESTRTSVAVTVSVVNAPTGNGTQTFVTGQTIANLVANGTSIVWFSSTSNASANTNPLATTTALTNGTTYYGMQTVAGCRSSSALAVTVTVNPLTPAPAITNVTATNVTFTTASINFNLNAFGSATTYVVEYTTDVLARWQTQSGGTTSVNTAAPFSVQLTNLQPDRRYYIRVRATNAAAQFTLSPEIQFNIPIPIVLTNVNDTNVTATTAQINYTLNTNGYNAFIEIRYQASTVFDDDAPFTIIVISNYTVNNTTTTNYNYVLTGLLPNTIYSYKFGAGTQNAGGVYTGEDNAFRTTPSLGLNDNNQRLNFSMYPNPANSIINIDLASSVKSVEIYSLLGQKVLSSTEKQVNISNLSNGVYLVKVEDENGSIATKKLVKE